MGYCCNTFAEAPFENGGAIIENGGAIIESGGAIFESGGALIENGDTIQKSVEAKMQMGKAFLLIALAPFVLVVYFFVVLNFIPFTWAN
jgi:hypothetical protein